MPKNNRKKEQFKRWFIISVILFFVGLFAIIFIGALYERGVEFSLTIIWTTIGFLLGYIPIFLLTLFILNTKLPKIENVRSWPQIVYFLLSALVIMVFVYFLMGSFIFDSLFRTFLPEKSLLVKSILLLGIILLLGYRLSLYFERIFPRKINELYHKTMEEIRKTIQNKAPWFKLNLSSILSGKIFIEKIRNIIFDFLVITFLLSLLTVFYGVSHKPDLSLFVPSRLGVLIAICIEIWFWYGLVQKRYWK